MTKMPAAVTTVLLSADAQSLKPVVEERWLNAPLVVACGDQATTIAVG